MPEPDLTPRPSLPRRALALVLAGSHAGPPAGGQSPNASQRVPTPTVYFGGKFRVVDFALSNCLNSGIRRVAVVTQYPSHSLARHLHRAWRFLKGDTQEFVALLPAQQGSSEPPHHCGTAGAVARIQASVDSHGADFVLVLTGEYIYKMNYAAMLADHVAKGRACTVACIALAPEQAGATATLAVDAQWHISDWQPAGVGASAATVVAALAPNTGQVLANMGIYVFNANYLRAELARDSADASSSHDFATDIVAHAVRTGRAAAHPFALSCVGTAPGAQPYWRDLHTLDAYWGANIALTSHQPPLNLYDTHWPIRTHQAPLAPAKFMHNEADRRGMALDSLVSGGSIISGLVLHSVLFSSVRVHSYASVEWSVLLPAVEVGCHARLRRVVVEHGCKIPAGLVVGEDAVADARRFLRTEGGVTWVTAEMIARHASLNSLTAVTTGREASPAGLP